MTTNNAETLRAARDMLRESAKQHRLAGDAGHARHCESIADQADAALASQPQAAGVGGDAVLALREAMQPVAEWMNAGGHDDDAYERGCHAAFKLLREHGPTLVNALAAPPKLQYCGDPYLREIVRDEFASALLAAGIQFMPGGYMDVVADEVVRRAFDPNEERPKEPEDDGTSKYAARRAEAWHAIAATRWQAERNTGGVK